jgi:hypothetical protein
MQMLIHHSSSALRGKDNALAKAMDSVASRRSRCEF